MTNAIKALLQMTSVSLQPVPSLGICRVVDGSDVMFPSSSGEIHHA
jgi:hypothetical protein